MSSESDFSELMALWKNTKKDTRKKNLQESTNLLALYGVPFESFNNGIHLKIRLKSYTIDFWPSTGRWKIEKTPMQGRGVYSLIDLIESERVAAGKPRLVIPQQQQDDAPF